MSPPPAATRSDGSGETATGAALTDRGRRLAHGAALGRQGVGVAFAVSAVVHLVRPEVFIPIVPARLPAPRRLVHLSGVAEAVCAGGLLGGAAWAGPASAALLLAVWPANISMALAAGSGRHPGVRGSRVLTWARVPLQLPMIWAVLAAPPRSVGSAAPGRTPGGQRAPRIVSIVSWSRRLFA